jgi:hypothetical protein
MRQVHDSVVDVHSDNPKLCITVFTKAHRYVPFSANTLYIAVKYFSKINFVCRPAEVKA